MDTMRKHRERTQGTRRSGTELDRLALHRLSAGGRLCFSVGRALNPPPASDRPADQARAQRIGLAVAVASIGR
ncbi:hypothetical protein [Streptomyces wuyuanensis]|uniref:hypothetical protein n=1 Tax=Streptomyces wuyuanensis TaxID=1196353 RepID=UPI0034290742